MPRKKTKASVEKELTKEVIKLAQEVRKLKSLEFVKILNRPWKFMGFSFLKGLMVGFGSVLGASFLVGLVIYILAQISFVPIIGDFVEDIMGQIEISVPSNGENGEDMSIAEQFNEAQKKGFGEESTE